MIHTEAEIICVQWNPTKNQNRTSELLWDVCWVVEEGTKGSQIIITFFYVKRIEFSMNRNQVLKI